MDECPNYLILCINPGSTSTKVGLYRGETPLRISNIEHKAEEIKGFSRVAEQLEYRAKFVEDFLDECGVPPDSLAAVIGRGGMMKPIPGCTYLINETMKQDLAQHSIKYYGSEHIANLGAALAERIAARGNAIAMIIDPISTDDYIPITRISGVPEVERVSLMHSLNLRAKARKAAARLGVDFAEVNMIGCHLGGGISMAAFEKGHAIDANHGLLGYGPFSPQRAGTLAISAVMDLCFSGKYKPSDLMKKFGKNSGLMGYLGTDDGREVGKRIAEGDKVAKLVYEAMALQTAKEIAAMAAVLSGEVACIFLTGGIANDKKLAGWIEARVKFISPVFIFPGEDEIEAMAEGGLRVLVGIDEPMEYSKHDSLCARLANPDKFKILNNL